MAAEAFPPEASSTRKGRPWGLYVKIILGPILLYSIFEADPLLGPGRDFEFEPLAVTFKALGEALIGLVVLRLAANLAELRVVSKNHVAPRLMRSAGWAAFWSLFFLFSLERLFTSKDLDIRMLAAGAAAFVVGRALYKEEKLIDKDALGRRLAFALSGVMLMAAGVYLLGQGAGPFVPYRTETTATALVGTVVLTFLVLLIPLMNHANAPVRWFAREFGTSRGKTVSLATTIYGYYAFRPTIAGGVSHLEVYEYFLGLAIAGYVFNRMRNHYKREMSETPYSSPHKKHSQEIERRPDRSFVEIKDAVREFLDGRPVTDRYRGVLAEAFKGAGLAEADVAKALQPVDAYKDERRPLLPIGFLVKKVEAANRARRADLHKQVMQTLSGGIGQ